MARLALATLLGIAWLTALAAAPAQAATKAAPVKAKVLKPLTLTSIQDFDLGTIILGPGTWPATAVGIARIGTFSCAGPNVSCAGIAQVARYRVTGSNQQPVTINAPNVTLTNQSDPTKTLLLVVDAPATINLPNSGNQGVIFPIGGSVNVSSSTSTGIYVGTFAVTVDYQ